MNELRSFCFSILNFSLSSVQDVRDPSGHVILYFRLYIHMTVTVVLFSAVYNYVPMVITSKTIPSIVSYIKKLKQSYPIAHNNGNPPT